MLVLLDLVRILSYKRCTESNPQKLYTKFFFFVKQNRLNAKVNLSSTFLYDLQLYFLIKEGGCDPISLKLIEIIYENASEFQPVN